MIIKWILNNIRGKGDISGILELLEYSKSQYSSIY